MKGCPRCDSVSAWVLGDGRRKCQSCGRRYRWKSVWDSVRLSEAAKEALLDAFVRGMPAAQLTAEHACADSRERFYRLLRACCVKHERPSRDGLSVVECSAISSRTRPSMRGWSTSQRVMIVGFTERAGLIQISAPPGGIAHVLPKLPERIAVGGVLQLDETSAAACLPIQGAYVIAPTMTRGALVMSPAEAFWRHTRLHLQMFRKIPVKFFQLYLADACLRFNQRNHNLHALLREIMETTAIGDLKPLLLGDSLRIGQGQTGFVPNGCGESTIRVDTVAL
jgi:transposase